MTPEQVNRWLADMRLAGHAKTDADCARLLDVSANTIATMKRTGVVGSAARRTALACAALLAGMQPYG